MFTGAGCDDGDSAFGSGKLEVVVGEEVSEVIEVRCDVLCHFSDVGALDVWCEIVRV